MSEQASSRVDCTASSTRAGASLPQAASRLDNRAQIWPDEVRVSVETLNLDAASYRQLAEKHTGPDGRLDGEALRAEVLDIVATRGKMQNPVTGSGGMLIGTVEAVGPQSPLGLKPGPRRDPGLAVADPLEITDGLQRWDGRSERVPAQGHAILFGRSIAAVLPEDLSPELALMVMDVCGAPALVARVVREYAAQPDRGGPPTVVVLGGAGKSGSLALAAAGDAGAGRRIAVVPVEREADLLEGTGWPTRWSLPMPGVRSGSRRPSPQQVAPPTSPSCASTCPGASSPPSCPPRRAAPSSSSRWPPTSRRPRSVPRGSPPTCACWSATATSPATRHTPSSWSAKRGSAGAVRGPAGGRAH